LTTDWVPVTGDWDYDGHDTVGLYDPAKGQFHLSNDSDRWTDTTVVTTITASISRVEIGAAWKPIIGDWDDNGTDTLGLYDPATNHWYLSNAKLGWSTDIVLDQLPTVPDTWIPLSGNWDGIGGDTIGLYDPEADQWYLNNRIDGTTTSLRNPSTPKVPDTWIPVTGDWNGNGRDSIGLYDPNSGTWYLNNRVNGSTTDLLIIRGRPTSPNRIPLAGDWDASNPKVILDSASTLATPLSAPVPVVVPDESEAAGFAAFTKLDVNQDGLITPLDVLAVANAVNRAEPTPLADLDGNGVVNPADVLRLIHVVNAMESGPVNGGKGESVPGPGLAPAVGLPAAGLLPSGESQTQNPLVPVEQVAVLGRGQQASERGLSVADDELAGPARGWLDEILDELAADWLG
jgi:hypothetical protein